MFDDKDTCNFTPNEIRRLWKCRDELRSPCVEITVSRRDVNSFGDTRVIAHDGCPWSGARVCDSARDERNPWFRSWIFKCVVEVSRLLLWLQRCSVSARSVHQPVLRPNWLIPAVTVHLMWSVHWRISCYKWKAVADGHGCEYTAKVLLLESV